jgi:predicted RNA-binding Zn-ribbon protein involved in translation (DUF1610 family)
MSHQPPLLPDPPTPDQAAHDAQRVVYRERLRQHLRDPAFRAIEGFPIGQDDAILALSDPPYYTACPNPFLPEIIARWQTQRAQLRQKLGLPDDADNVGNDNGNSSFVLRPSSSYHREPFAADVSEGKNDPIYNAHSYHTKVPHKAIMRYVLHYTDPGDVVFDGFCGTGMTGVAAQLCADRGAVQSLGYRVDEEGLVYDGDQAISRLGARKAVLVDLSPAATFIAYNYNTPVDVATFEREAGRILREVEEECGWMYETWHPHCEHPQRVKGRINYTVWSDVFVCPQCGEEMVFWDVALDGEAGRVRSSFPCPDCGAEQSKRSLERAWETVYDPVLNQVMRRAKQVAVLINYSVGRRRHEKVLDTEDLAVIQQIEEGDIPYWFPTDRMPEGDESRRNDDIGMTHIQHFYTRRNLWVLSALWQRICSAHFAVRSLLEFCFTANLRSVTRLASIAFSYYFRGGGGPINAGTKGTLYVSSTIPEVQVIRAFRGRANRFAKLFRRPISRNLIVSNTLVASQSSTSLVSVMDQTMDYVFVDPPFGGNLMYSELSFYWEAWLCTFTNSRPEAVVNKVQRKALSEYQRLMEQCFREFYRVLKPGRWMTVEFHNSQNRVWNAIQEAILRTGFMVADVRTLDKKQGSFKQYTTTSATKQDLIISAYKPRTGFERRFQAQAGTPDGAWSFVRQHLAQLPIVVQRDGTLEAVAERQPYLLFDRMVAFHIQRGATVPLSAAEFYGGLRQRFVERDGMVFNPDQIPAYDRARLLAAQVAQLTLFVSDEKSALQWLRQQLDPATGGQPQTYQDLQPQFLRQLHQARHEALPELNDMLEQNFLQDQAGRWYVPDPSRAEDLEKLRRRALLREFAAYVEGRVRLRQFRTEAVRAGFADAWQRQDYATIIQVAERLPAAVLQEDPDLLMYYDNATLRAGGPE